MNTTRFLSNSLEEFAWYMLDGFLKDEAGKTTEYVVRPPKSRSRTGAVIQCLAIDFATGSCS